MSFPPALALIEIASLARAYRVLDAVAKKAPITVVQFAEVSPGKTLLVLVGEVCPVEESLEEARVCAGDALVDLLLLPAVHPAIPPMLLGRPCLPAVDAVGVLETRQAAAAVRAADAGLKAAGVGLLKLRLAAGIGGKGLVLLTGPLEDVQAALDGAEEAAGAGNTLGRELIPQPHPEIVGRFTA